MNQKTTSLYDKNWRMAFEAWWRSRPAQYQSLNVSIKTELEIAYLNGWSDAETKIALKDRGKK